MYAPFIFKYTLRCKCTLYEKTRFFITKCFSIGTNKIVPAIYATLSQKQTQFNFQNKTKLKSSTEHLRSEMINNFVINFPYEIKKVPQKNLAIFSTKKLRGGLSIVVIFFWCYYIGNMFEVDIPNFNEIIGSQKRHSDS